MHKRLINSEGVCAFTNRVFHIQFNLIGSGNLLNANLKESRRENSLWSAEDLRNTLTRSESSNGAMPVAMISACLSLRQLSFDPTRTPREPSAFPAD